MNIAIFSANLKTVEINQLDFILALIEKGHNPVIYVINDNSESELFNKIKVKVVNVDCIDTDVCQLRSFGPVNKLADLFEEYNIDILVASSAAACIYGAIAAKRAGVKKVYLQFTGIGRLFQTNKKFRKTYTKFLCKHACQKADKVIFHNIDNMMLFTGKKLVSSDKVVQLGGFGINVEEYSKKEYLHINSFLMAAPLSVDKGVWEYIHAAGIVKQLKKDCTFKLLVKHDSSPYAISQEELAPYVEKGYIELVENYDDNLESMMEDCSCFVLPSYHESMPFELLLAMAKGRPVIATDVPGCRDAVLDGINGYIVPPQDVEVLVGRILDFMEQPEKAAEMAAESYNICTQKYDAYDVCDKLLDLMFTPVGDEENE